LCLEARNGVKGRVVRNAIDHQVGFGLLGELVQRFLIRGHLERIFAYRQKALKQLLLWSRSV
jgi:hypothetical protein